MKRISNRITMLAYLALGILLGSGHIFLATLFYFTSAIMILGITNYERSERGMRK